MKKTVYLLMTFVLLIMSVGCGNLKNLNNKDDNSLANTKNLKKIIVGLDDSYPPMEFRNEKNNLVGFDIDLGKKIAEKLGVKFEVVTTDFSGMLLALKSKKFDMILSGMSITEERKKTINFTEPYLLGGQVIAVKNNNNSIKSFLDLKGKTIGCQLGSTGHKAAETKLKHMKELKKYGKITDAFSDLEIGRIDGVIMDGQVGGYYLSKKAGSFKILNETITKEPMGIGFRMEDKKLKQEVQKIIDKLKKDGILSELSIKWFGFDAYK